MGLLNLIFPKKCLECGREGKYICISCLKKVGFSGWHNQNIYSVWQYQGVVRKAILALKYKYVTGVAQELVEICARQLGNQKWKPAYLVPIPLHWYRENFRGFNQTEVIGKKLAKKLGWQFVPDLLVRQKYTLPQAQLKLEARLRNLCGVFTVNLKSSILHNQLVILFDDVYTTGSTLKEAREVLEKVGFNKIRGLTLAK
jgi:competence protein ComFC